LPTLKRIIRGEKGINHQEIFVALTSGAKMLSALLNVSIEKSFWADIQKLLTNF
jgi:hypothetical protein